ncbi:MAG: hypothetical protein P1V36_02095 [Planctomycetota bacterium]|nr:hypothetical protein [Planctomycetota bacterium]
MLRVTILGLLVLGVLLGHRQRTALAHTPPPAYLSITISDRLTTIRIVAQVGVIRDWVGIAPRDLPFQGTIAPGHRTLLERKLAGWLRVHVDGVPARATLGEATVEGFQDHGFTWRYATLEMRVPTAIPPKQVGIAWTRYAEDTNYLFDDIAVEREAYGESRYFALSPSEPEFIWHRPRDVADPGPVVLPPPIRPPQLVLPLLSLGLALLGLLGMVLLRSRLTGRHRAALLASTLLLAALAWPVARVEVERPWGRPAARPPDDEALAIFASLHRGTYAALDGETEEAVYDQLAGSVTGALLPSLYLDIHRSMILQEAGGAVAKVKKTEIVDAEVLPSEAEDAAWFTVHARWRVEGKVGHWGHSHQRTNEYTGHITVVAVDGRWKIAALEILDEVRLDEGGLGKPPGEAGRGAADGTGGR